MSEEQQTQAPVNIPGINDDSMIKLGDKEYRFGDLSDQAKQIVAALRNSEQQILNTRNQLGLMDVGRRALAAQLRVAVENPEAQQQNEQG